MKPMRPVGARVVQSDVLAQRLQIYDGIVAVKDLAHQARLRAAIGFAFWAGCCVGA